MEVHSIRNSQVILRARSSKAGPTPRSLPVSRAGSLRCGNGDHQILSEKTPLIQSKMKSDMKHSHGRPGSAGSLNRSLSDSWSRGCLRLRNGHRCPLMEQSMDVLEKILKLLTARDLAMLSLTSKALNFVVRTYVQHHCERTNLRVQFDDFCERNKDCLLPKEIALQERIKLNAKPNLLLFSTGNHYLGKSNKKLSNPRSRKLALHAQWKKLLVVRTSQYEKARS